MNDRKISSIKVEYVNGDFEYMNDIDLFDPYCVLKNENQKLKHQIEQHFKLEDRMTYEYRELEKQSANAINKQVSRGIDLINQQKEFILWLEENIKNYELPLTDENKKALGYTLPMKGIYKEVLEKYKELIGDNND